ncbi:hypothetical protein Tco_1242117, partial [Tanacetum coccineum]
SLGKVARERIPGELSPSDYPGRHVARDKYPQRHVARESVEMSLGIVVNVVVCVYLEASMNNLESFNIEPQVTKSEIHNFTTALNKIQDQLNRVIGE